MEQIVLNSDQKDALQEVANIGASHAATVLSQMINKEIKIGIPSIDILPLEQTVDCVKDQEVVAGVFLKILRFILTYLPNGQTHVEIQQQHDLTVSY